MDALTIIIPIVAAILTFCGATFGYYMYIRKKVESTALGAINQAEDTDKVGEEKFKDAVDAVMSVVPAVLKPVISRTIVEKIVQKVFDQVAEFAKKQVTKSEE